MKGKSLAQISLFALPLAALLAGACDKASPVAPTGTTLSVSATPSQIAASGESATIRVTAIRPNGTPAYQGTQIRLDTTLGTVEPVVETDRDGVATGSLEGDGRIGTATVTARTGASDMATVDVGIGKFAASITLQASPGQVSGLGGNVSLLAVVRNDQGQPQAGALVNFQTQVGTLDSRGSLVSTDTSGEATDTLRVTADDVASFNAPSFTVTAIVGGSGGGTQQSTATIRILATKPIADFIARDGGEFRVFFDNQTQGEQPITYAWDFQNDGTDDSTETSPTYNYGVAGMFTVRLTATNSIGTSVKIKTITVPIQ
jgi:PKD domain